MEHRAPFLYSLVVAPADDLAVDYQDRPNGDPACGETGLGFGDRGSEEWIVTHTAESPISVSLTMMLPTPPNGARLRPNRSPDFLSHPTDILITMSNDTIESQPLIDPFDDPVGYLAQFGLNAELVVFEELTLPLAA